MLVSSLWRLKHLWAAQIFNLYFVFMLILHFPQFSRPLPPAPWPPFVCTECFSSRVRRSLFHSIILQPLAWLCRYRQRKTLFVCIERKIAFKCSLVVKKVPFSSGALKSPRALYHLRRCAKVCSKSYFSQCSTVAGS